MVNFCFKVRYGVTTFNIIWFGWIGIIKVRISIWTTDIYIVIIQELKQVPEGKDEWEAIKEMAVYFRKSNDSTAVCTVNVPGGMKGGVPLQLRPIEKFHSYIYYPRPFKFQAVEKADHFRIPLALYGSAWLDKQHDFIRFCGEREIDPGMKSEILKDIPHYYVIGIEFKSAKN